MCTLILDKLYVVIWHAHAYASFVNFNLVVHAFLAGSSLQNAGHNLDNRFNVSYELKRDIFICTYCTVKYKAHNILKEFRSL